MSQVRPRSFPPWLLEIIRSPGTGQRLRRDGNCLVSSDGLQFSIVKGIPCLISTKSNLANQAYYDQIAKKYREQDDFWNNPYDTEIWRLEHDLIRDKLTLFGPMLDVGCGFYPHSEFGHIRPLVAGDISLRSLQVAQESGDETGSVSFIQLDATSLPFADRSFASLLAGGELLNHIPDYRCAMTEFQRVLKPGGICLLQVGTKWCLDSLWAIVDSFTGHPFGYSMNRHEALSFFRTPKEDVSVTWRITPTGSFRISLLSIGKLLDITKEMGFDVVDHYGANVLSGVVPLPIQQESKNKILQSLTALLVRIDRLVARFPFLQTFAGNVFLVCQKRA